MLPFEYRKSARLGHWMDDTSRTNIGFKECTGERPDYHKFQQYAVCLMRPSFRKNVRESRDSCTVRCRGVGAEDIVEKCAKLYRPGINIQMRKTFKCAKLYCPGTNKCAKLYRPGTNVHRLVCAVTHSRKGMLCTLNLDINKRCVPFYTKIIFRSGTKVYAVVQHLSQVQKNLVLLIFHGWCSYDFLQAGLYVPGTDL